MAEELPLWRVWLNGRWALVRAKDKDAVYRSYRPRRRAQITRVDRVLKTSEGVEKRKNEEATRPRKRQPRRRP